MNEKSSMALTIAVPIVMLLAIAVFITVGSSAENPDDQITGLLAGSAGICMMGSSFFRSGRKRWLHAGLGLCVTAMGVETLYGIRLLNIFAVIVSLALIIFAISDWKKADLP